MSKKVDDRVVEMRFDNRDFENNVSTSIKTLAKLKESLNLSSASRNISALNAEVNRFNASGMARGVDEIRVRFSALQAVALGALMRIGSEAANAAKKLADPINPIRAMKDGFAEYEIQMNSIQTIMANTGKNVSTVNKALDELNTYADKTIYNFSEMTKNIGTFTAAGVDLDTSVSAIQGIANLAAISGSTSQQASSAMYQLSQALAAGKVQLMDWNSVVNAGMGGKVFQDALVKTSERLKTGAKEAIKTYGSFRDSLTHGEWLTTQVLTETLQMFTTSGANEYVAEYTGLTVEAVEAALESAEAQYGEADAIKEASKALAEKSGKNADEIESALQLAKTAEEAATKVKTFSQLIDTTKEALGSGWAQTWRIIIGDFEEAKTVWTSASDTLNNIIDNMAQSRNDLLRGWADLGGRDDLIQSFVNIYTALSRVVIPLKTAFREVFPKKTADDLYKITAGLKKFTESLILTKKQSENLKNVFKGLFSVVNIGLTPIKMASQILSKLFESLSNVNTSNSTILGIAAALGSFISKIDSSIQKTVSFDTVINNLERTFNKVSASIKDFGNAIKDKIGSINLPEVHGFAALLSLLNGIMKVSIKVASAATEAIGKAIYSVVNFLNNSDIFKLANNVLFSGVLLELFKGIKNFKKGTKDFKKVIKEVTDSFKAFQNSLNADAIQKIAIAIGILAISLLSISKIPAQDLEKSCYAIATLFAELMVSFAIFSKISTNIGKLANVTKAIGFMIGLSTAILTLSIALKSIGSLNPVETAQGLVTIGVSLFTFLQFFKVFDTDAAMAKSAARSILIISGAMIVLSLAIRSISSISFGKTIEGLIGITVTLKVFLAFFNNLSAQSGTMVAAAASIAIISGAITVLSLAIFSISNISFGKTIEGLIGIAAALKVFLIFFNSLSAQSGTMVAAAAGIFIVSGAMIALSAAVLVISSIEHSGKAIATLGGSLLILSVALNSMTEATPGAKALIVASSALVFLALALNAMDNVEKPIKSLLLIASSLVILGAASAILSPFMIELTMLSKVLISVGIAALSFGAGVALLAVGLNAIVLALTSLAMVGTGAAMSLVVVLDIIITGIATMIPIIAKEIGEGIVAIAVVIGEAAPQLAEAALKLISETLNAVSQYAPQIVDSLLTLVISILNGLAARMPELVSAIRNVISSLIGSIVDSLKSLTTEGVLKGIAVVGAMSALIVALNLIKGMIPGAMIGLAGIGLVVAELAAIIMAFGAIRQLPGIDFLLGEGGFFLEELGSAIGQFVGGIVGGAAVSISSRLPEIGTNLSEFINTLKPFIEGVKNIDSSILDNVHNLFLAVLELSSANLINGITRFITGSGSMNDFAEDIIVLGEGLSKFGASVSGLNTEDISKSVEAMSSLTKMAEDIPNEGGFLGLFVGDNNLGNFGNQLVPFGKGLKKYGDSVRGVDATSISESAKAAKGLSDLANAIPDQGGLLGLFDGTKNLKKFGKQLVPFGKSIKEYGDAVKDINTSSISNASKAISLLSDVSEDLVPLANALKVYGTSVKGVDNEAIEYSVAGVRAIAQMYEYLPNTGGVVSFFTVDNDLGDFGKNLVSFGEGMKSYADIVTGINVEAINLSVVAAKGLAELANEIPKTGGLVSLFSGNSGIGDFGTKLSSFGLSLKTYSDNVAGINVEAINVSVSAAKGLADLANVLPSTGGLVSLLSGDGGLDTFGYNIVPFGKALKEYGDAVSGIDVSGISESAKAAQGIAEVANAIPKNGGLAQLFTGGNDLEAFSLYMAPFGKGLKAYSDSVVGIDVSSISNSITGAKSLAEMANNLVNIDISGLALFSSISPRFPEIGTSVKMYADAVAGIDPNAITGSLLCAQMMVTLTNNTAGIDISGLETFVLASPKLTTLGGNMKSYSEMVTGLNIEPFMNSITGAKKLVELSQVAVGFVNAGVDKLAKSRAGIVSMGGTMKMYSESVADINLSAIYRSSTAAKKIIEIVNEMSNINTSGVSSFSSALKQLGNVGVSGFIKAFDGIDGKLSKIGTTMITSITRGIKGGMSSLSGVGYSVVNTLISAVKSRSSSLSASCTTLVNGMLKAVRSKYNDFKTAGTTMMTRLISGINSKKSGVTSAAKSAVSGAASGARGYYSSFYSAGQYLGQGLVNGISSKQSAARSAGAALGNAAKQAMNAAMGINSPSKYAYQSGIYFGIGLINALMDSVNKVKNASNTLGNAIRNGLDDSVSKVKEYISDGVNETISIRPVMDFGNIKSGIDELNSIFNNESFDILTNVGAVNSLINKRNQNNPGDDIISAINKLRGDIGNINRPSYNIAGITYDDGSNISDAVESLIRAAKIERRV